MADLSDDIETAAQGPKSANVDGDSATARDIRELIEADEYLARKNASNRSALPIRTAKIRPDGTT